MSLRFAGVLLLSALCCGLAAGCSREPLPDGPPLQSDGNGSSQNGSHGEAAVTGGTTSDSSDSPSGQAAVPGTPQWRQEQFRQIRELEARLSAQAATDPAHRTTPYGGHWVHELGGYAINDGLLAGTFLGSRDTTDESLANLAASAQRPIHLQRIDLSSSEQISDAGLAHLASVAENVRELLLPPHLTNDSLVHLRPLKHLRLLDASYLPISDEGLSHLGGLRQLQTLVIGDARQLTPAGLHGLKRANPGLTIYTPMGNY
jgi:hypothetical protein